MPSEVRQKKIMEKLNRAQKCSILGPQNLGSGGGPLDPHLLYSMKAGLTFQGHEAMCVCVYMWRKYMHAAAFIDSFFRH